jgi:hypothetical protein
MVCNAALLTSSPYKNKLTEDLEKKAAKGKKKAGNEKKEAGEKQNQPRRGKKKDATNGSTRNRKREITLSDTSDSDDVFEESILVENVDEDSDDDAECPLCKELFSTDRCGEKWFTCIKCHQ